MTSPSVIETHSLSISFRSGDEVVSAVRNVNIALKQGKTLAVVGESGSGKTVSSLCLMGLLDPRAALFNSGTIYLSEQITKDNVESYNYYMR